MTSQANELPLRKLEKSRKFKIVVNFYFFESEKNLQIQPMSFSYIGIAKKCTNPAILPPLQRYSEKIY